MEKKMLDSLGPTLRLLRVTRGKRQWEVAQAAGIRIASVSSYESGKSTPQLSTLEKILRSLDVSFDDFADALRAVNQLEANLASADSIEEPQAEYVVDFPSYSAQVAHEVQRSLEKLEWQYSQRGHRLADLASAHKLAERMLALVPSPSPWDELLGPFYGTRQVEQILGGISRQAVAERRQRKTLLGLRTTDGAWVYPAFQFDEQGEVLDGLSAVLQSFREDEIDDWSLAGWLVSPLTSLGGSSPVQWLRRNADLETLLAVTHDAARRFAQ